MIAKLTFTLAALTVVACGSSVDSDAPGADGIGGLPDGGGSGSDGTSDEFGTLLPDGGGNSPECDDNLRSIYVLTRDAPPGAIHRFDPASLTFAEILHLDCPDSAGWEVSSMAVDRGYHAWIQWGRQGSGTFESRLDRVDLASGACQANYAKPPIAAILGMAFTSDQNGSSGEQLFFVDSSTNLYAPTSSAAIGHFYDFKPYEGTQFSGVELSGTGAGRLFTMIMNWAFEWDHPCTAQDPCSPTVHLGEFNKLDGTAISNVEVPGVKALGISPGGMAFAHWGGRFWFFVSKDFGPTLVYDYDPVTNTTVLAKSDGPRGVVGAGVSTCAPLDVPR